MQSPSTWRTGIPFMDRIFRYEWIGTCGTTPRYGKVPRKATDAALAASLRGPIILEAFSGIIGPMQSDNLCGIRELLVSQSVFSKFIRTGAFSSILFSSVL